MTNSDKCISQLGDGDDRIKRHNARFSDQRPALKGLIGKKELVVAEIGVEDGVNSLSILENYDIKKLYLIDPWIMYGNMNGSGVGGWSDTNPIEWINNYLSDYKGKFEIIHGLSQDVSSRIKDNELDAVYIDGNHRYEFVRTDIELYYPKVKKGGIIGGHDYKDSEPGVKQAVGERFANFGQSNWDWWVTK